MNRPLPRIAITVGDPAGIGPEICLEALDNGDLRAACRPLLIGDPEVLRRCAEALDKPWPEGLPIEPVPVEGEWAPGRPSAAGGRAAEAAIRRACALGLAGEIDAIATGPIDKRSLRMAGVEHIGHTEILADAFGVDDPLTMFVTEGLRVLFYTRHLSLRQAIDAVERGRVLRFIERAHEAARALGVPRPRLGLAALNPHAGDGGQFGDEEIEHLLPAAAEARRRGIDVSDPIGADSIFHLGLEGVFDVVLSLYHDQGHIATKTRDYFGTVTATLGLPVLRTSVDHGTAFDIAWQGQARSISLVRAAQLAAELLSF